MRVDPSEHLARPLLVHSLAADFELLDVWRLPVAPREGECDFEQFLRSFPLLQPRTGRDMPWQVRALTGLRGWLGRVFGWDDAAEPLPIPGCSERSIRERMSPAARERYAIAADSGSFKGVYTTHDESLYEVSNATVHALLHLSWVVEGEGHRAYMAVYSKSRGLLGQCYMAVISPFRHFIVYPAMMAMIERAWRTTRHSALSA